VPLAKNYIKSNDGIGDYTHIFQNKSRAQFFDHKSNEDTLEELKFEQVDEKLQRYKLERLQDVTGMYISSAAEVMLNCRTNGRRLLRSRT
jgi:hypothetical protein